MIGPTGEKPVTSRNSDRGGLCASISLEDGGIVIDFATQLNWLSMSAAQARAFAASLVKKADELENPELAERAAGFEVP